MLGLGREATMLSEYTGDVQGPLLALTVGNRHGITMNLKVDRYTVLAATLPFHKVHFIPNKAVPSLLGKMVTSGIKTPIYRMVLLCSCFS